MKRLFLILASTMSMILLIGGCGRIHKIEKQLNDTSWYEENSTTPSLVFNADGTYIYGEDTGTWETQNTNVVLQDTGTDEYFQPIDILFESDYGEEQIVTIIDFSDGHLTLLSDYMGQTTYIDAPSK